MIQLTSLHGRTAGTAWVARRFPVRLGRSAACPVRLDDDGVWDEHAEIRLVRREGCVVSVLGQALLSINGQRGEQAVLHIGDVMELGSGRLLFSLSSTEQRSLRWRETLTWVALTALCLGQAALIYWLVG